MPFENMEPDDFMKRGYLLPEGCKDLTDFSKLKSKHPPQPHPDLSSVIFGEIIVREQTTVWDLAELLGQQKSTIIADLMKLGIFITVWDSPDFEVISKVARKYGFITKRAA